MFRMTFVSPPPSPAATPEEWWVGLPGPVWALFGVALTVISTAIIDVFRRRHEREESRRRARVEAHSALMMAVAEYVQAVSGVQSLASLPGAKQHKEDALVELYRAIRAMDAAKWRSQIVATENESTAIGEELASLIEVASDPANMSIGDLGRFAQIQRDVLARLRRDVDVGPAAITKEARRRH